MFTKEQLAAMRGCYFIYARRSDEDPDSQQNSITYQTENDLRYASTWKLPIAKVTIPGFCENGIIKERHSAFKTDTLDIRQDGSVRFAIERPKFQRLAVILQNRWASGIVVLCSDRLSRNKQDDTVIEAVVERGADVRYVQAAYDNSSSGALHRDMDSMFAIHHSRVTGEKVRLAGEALRAAGRCINLSPVGYLDAPADRTRGTPATKQLDVTRAPIVKRVFELYATGRWSDSQLAAWARGQGLTTKPSRRNRTKEELLADEEVRLPKIARPVTMKTIEQVLKNPFYAGKLRYKGDILPAVHEPLVSWKLFQRVQEMRRSRCRVVYGPEEPFFVYRGMLRCACGRLYSPYEQKGGAYYRVPCKIGCTSADRNLTEAEVDEMVVAILERASLSAQDQAALEARAPQELDLLTRQRDAKLKDLDRERAKIQRDRDYLVDNKITLLREGVYEPSQVAEQERRLELASTDLQDRRAKILTSTPHEMLKTVVNFFELVRLAMVSYKVASASEKREILLSALFELTIKDRNLAGLRAQPGLQRMLDRPNAVFGGPEFVFSELPELYADVLVWKQEQGELRASTAAPGCTS